MPSRAQLSNRMAIFMDLIHAIEEELDSRTVNSIAEEAGVSPGTITKWTDGTTMTPRIDTMVKVAKVLELELALKKLRRARNV